MACSETQGSTQENQTLVVSVTYPIQSWLIQNLVDPHLLEVFSYFGEEDDPHFFELSPHKILQLKRAQFYVGLGDSFDEDIQQKLSLPLFSMGSDIRRHPDMIHQHHHDDSGHTDKFPLQNDPHVWLGFKEISQMLEWTRHFLTKQFPSESALIDQRAEDLQSKLQEAYDTLSLSLKPYQGKNILVSHDAYAYLFNKYDLHQWSLHSEGLEPSFQDYTRVLESLAQQRHQWAPFLVARPGDISPALQQWAHQQKLQIIKMNPLQASLLDLLHQFKEDLDALAFP